MRRTRVLSVVGVGCLAVVTCGSQVEPPQLPPPGVRLHVRDERFQLVTSVSGLPLGVRDALQGLFGDGSLDIADPDAEFSVTGVRIVSGPPTRRLIMAGCSPDHCIVYYERGGKSVTRHAALFYWTPSATRLEWGGQAPNDLAAVADVRTALLSGLVKHPPPFW